MAQVQTIYHLEDMQHDCHESPHLFFRAMLQPGQLMLQPLTASNMYRYCYQLLARHP
jgi:hypothetical protein